MTREEVKQMFRDDVDSFGKPRAIMTKIDAIYNSLDKQKCPNCRYANLDSSRYLTVHKCSMGVSAIDYDFGCTYWKAKDTK